MDIEAGATLPSLPLWSSYAAVTVGGVAGASYAARRGFDVIGVLGLAVASGLGGLLLRDVLLMKGTPVVLTDPRYLLSASIAALVGFLFAGIIARLGGLLLALDALAMGLFVSLGAVAAFYYQLGVPAAIFLAVTTAIGGSILRDVLSGEPPAVMRPGIFSGIAALFGALVFVTLDYFGVATFWNQVATIAAVAGMRWLALWRKWESQSSEDFMGRIEDLLSKAAQPLASLPIAPAARARINSDDLSAEFTTTSAMRTVDDSDNTTDDGSGSASGSHGETSTTEDTQPARSEDNRRGGGSDGRASISSNTGSSSGAGSASGGGSQGERSTTEDSKPAGSKDTLRGTGDTRRGVGGSD